MKIQTRRKPNFTLFFVILAMTVIMAGLANLYRPENTGTVIRAGLGLAVFFSLAESRPV